MPRVRISTTLGPPPTHPPAQSTNRRDQQSKPRYVFNLLRFSHNRTSSARFGRPQEALGETVERLGGDPGQLDLAGLRPARCPPASRADH